MNGTMNHEMTPSSPHIEAQPTSSQAREVMYPWLFAALCQDLPTSDTFVATATLFDNQGQPVNGQLDGNRNVSGRRHENEPSGSVYFLFDTLAIRTPGTWRIQVAVTQFPRADTSGARSMGTTITEPICIVDRPVATEEYSSEHIKQLVNWLRAQ